MFLALLVLCSRSAASDDGMFPYHRTRVPTDKDIELSYVQLKQPCQKAVAVSGNVGPVANVAACEAKCTAQAAAAPGTGEAACVAVDTDGSSNCYMKSHCEGDAGACYGRAECGYRQAGVPPGPTPAPPAPPVPPSPPGVTLRQAAAKRGVYIGTATNVAGLTNASEPLYKQTEQAQFSLTTAENACKWGPIHPEQDTYTFEDCDYIFAEALAAKQVVRGHNLCWHTENPPWLLNGKWSPTQLTSILQDHIAKVVTHYNTSAYAWDVVNEALDNNGLKPSQPWYPAVPNYIDVAFQAARKAGGPDVKLFYNDYSVEGMSPKSDQMYKLVKSMQDRNIPIDGVGLQFHWGVQGHDSLDSVAQNMARFAALGLEIHITELDIKCTPKNSGQPCTPNLLNLQAQLYADILKTCLAQPKCTSFETWGFTDKHTWIGSASAPLLFDVNYKPKPAFDALVNLLLNGTAQVQQQAI